MKQGFSVDISFQSDTDYKGVTYFQKVDMTEATIKTLKPKHLSICKLI